MKLLLLLLLLLPVLLLGGCPGATPRECSLGADCASGVCLPDGTCAGLPDAAPGADAGLDAAPGADAAPSCVPDHDGVIAADEVRLGPGLSGLFRVGLDATVSTAGTTGPSGLEWDLGGVLAGDHDETIATSALIGAWYAGYYPTATHVVRLADGSELLGVFQATATELLLLGVVSPANNLYVTRLAYNPPVVVLRFPFQVGSTWTTSSTVTGWASGVYCTYWEDTVVSVDAAGTVKTPYGDFPVLRVRTDLDRLVGVLTTTVRTYAFVAECYGTVATIVSQDNESAVEFTSAAEVRRLAP